MNKTIIRRLTIICYVSCFLILVLLSFAIESKGLIILLLMVSVPFIALVIYTIRYIKLNIIIPLEYLTKEAKTISSGDLSHEISANSKDEIGYFISAFDNMRSALNKQQQAQQAFEKERKNFINSISHDLKTPLASMSAYIEALQDGIGSTPEEKIQYYKIIENKISILAELSNQLSMSYDTPEDLSLSLNKVNCYTWSADFLGDMAVENLMNKTKADLVNDIPSDDESCILIDIHQLDRVLFNLTNNALRYSDKLLLIRTSIENNKFVISIENDGAKIKSENLNRIFERFYTEEEPNNQGHLGLGLYIAKTTINAMNGAIEVQKKDDIIQFKIILPIR